MEDEIQGCQIQALSLMPLAKRPKVDVQLLLTLVLICRKISDPQELYLRTTAEKVFFVKQRFEPRTSQVLSQFEDHQTKALP